MQNGRAGLGCDKDISCSGVRRQSGVAAGYGICVAMQSLNYNATVREALIHLTKSADYLAGSRPTAVNLFWALDRMKIAAKRCVAERPDANFNELCKRLLDEADAICDEDKLMCKQIGIKRRAIY